MHVSIDGTYLRINGPSSFNSKQYSHKFKSAVVRYEIGISIGGADIVWALNGLEAGEWKKFQDLYVEFSIFKSKETTESIQCFCTISKNYKINCGENLFKIE